MRTSEISRQTNETLGPEAFALALPDENVLGTSLTVTESVALEDLAVTVAIDHL